MRSRCRCSFGIFAKVWVYKDIVGSEMSIEDIYSLNTYRILALGAYDGPVLPYFSESVEARGFNAEVQT